MDSGESRNYGNEGFFAGMTALARSICISNAELS